MAEQIFSDGLMSITLHDGVVRLDFVTLMQGQNEDELQSVFRKRLVMSLPDFIRSFARLRENVNKMVEEGVLVRSTGGDV